MPLEEGRLYDITKVYPKNGHDNLRQHRIMGQGDSASVLAQAKVWKMREYCMYFPFFILHDWGKRSAEARCPHLSGVALTHRANLSSKKYFKEFLKLLSFCNIVGIGL